MSRDGFGNPSPGQPTHLHTQAESGAYLLDSSRVPRRRPFLFFKRPYAIGSVPSLSGRAIAYRCRSLPRACRHRASKPQGSSEQVLPWQVAINQLICAFLSHGWRRLHITQSLKRHAIFRRSVSLNGEHFHALRLAISSCGLTPISATNFKGDTALDKSCKWPKWSHFNDAEIKLHFSILL